MEPLETGKCSIAPCSNPLINGLSESVGAALLAGWLACGTPGYTGGGKSPWPRGGACAGMAAIFRVAAGMVAAETAGIAIRGIAGTGGAAGCAAVEPGSIGQFPVAGVFDISSTCNFSLSCSTVGLEGIWGSPVSIGLSSSFSLQHLSLQKDLPLLPNVPTLQDHRPCGVSPSCSSSMAVGTPEHSPATFGQTVWAPCGVLRASGSALSQSFSSAMVPSLDRHCLCNYLGKVILQVGPSCRFCQM